MTNIPFLKWISRYRCLCAWSTILLIDWYDLWLQTKVTGNDSSIIIRQAFEHWSWWLLLISSSLVVGNFYRIKMKSYLLEVLRWGLCCNLGKSTKNPAGIFRFFYVTVYLHVFIQQQTVSVFSINLLFKLLPK